MIHFDPIIEPLNFEDLCRRPGLAYLHNNPDCQRPPKYWTPFKTILADGFNNLCAYTVIYEPVGTVDHFISIKQDRNLAYDWANYRYASQWINSCKKHYNVLDPFAVVDGWFEIILPSLQLVLTNQVPPEHREIAESTLKRLHLRDDERVIRSRLEWYRMYQEGELNLEGLRRKAPLIARAVDKQLAAQL